MPSDIPQLVCEIEVDTTKCVSDCVDCEKACPLELAWGEAT